MDMLSASIRALGSIASENYRTDPGRHSDPSHSILKTFGGYRGSRRRTTKFQKSLDRGGSDEALIDHSLWKEDCGRTQKETPDAQSSRSALPIFSFHSFRQLICEITGYHCQRPSPVSPLCYRPVFFLSRILTLLAPFFVQISLLLESLFDDAGA